MRGFAGTKAICAKCRLEYPGEALFCPMCGTAKSRDFEADPALGTVVGERYLIQERLGHGASGTIYRGEHVTLQRPVAIKVLHDELSRDELAIERFRRAATTVGEIDNDHIVAIHDFGRLPDGRLYVAMELLEGETLAEVLAREKQLPIARALDILGQLGAALMEAHAIGYVHRDLRPRNVFLARWRGRSDFVKLLDFGLAKLVEDGEAASTSLGMTFGDPRYMSPEQARGDGVDRRADIYSLGCIGYEMIVGDPPFVAPKVFEVLTQHLERPPVPPSVRRPDLPRWFEAALLTALAKRADDRFVTAFRFVQALREGERTGRAMSEDTARRRETNAPPSVTQALQRLGRATDADDAPPRAAPGSPTARRRPAADPPAAAPGGEDPSPAASASGERGKSSSRAASQSGHGISAVWYADGEAISRQAADDAAASGPPQRVQRRVGPSDTGLISYDIDYDDEAGARHPRRAWWIVGGLAAALVAALIVVASGRDDRPPADPVALESPPVAAPPPLAEPVDPVALESPPVAAPPPLAGPPAAAAEPSPGEPEPMAPEPVDIGPVLPEPLAVDPAEALPSDAPAARRPTRPPAERAAPARTAPNDLPAVAPAPAASQADSAQADFFAKLGDKALADGDVLDAAANFAKSLSLQPANPDAVAGLGEIAVIQAHWADAVAHLSRATRLAPNRARFHMLLGEAQLGRGQPELAAAAFRRALQIDPDDEVARAGYAEAAEKAGL